MKILCVIPARGGSKRLPKKNLECINGQSLIERASIVVRNIDHVVDTIVTSDSKEIINHSKDLGLLAPFVRPKNLSSDEASSVDVVIHALNWYESNINEVDAILLLQPTSPFRKKSSILKAIDLLINKNCKSVISVNLTHSHPKWTFKYSNEYLETYLEDHGLNTRSQDLDPAYVVNGNIYLIYKKALIQNKSFFTDQTIPYILNNDIECLDIDTHHDLELARYYSNNKLWKQDNDKNTRS
ncbi:MAG: acylneuraminate cytidylyltransferase family protein [Candidatus Marinimicrobia bacterium]|nr:acylneuraminate cytidylyltransferase family protein [Candidatus Neomarinimicrobiota bacterium]MDA1363879.1 acylneuraminate cytidylyltransferase family protein [Candidatus Neomarinimicrobiota bacterium]